MNENGIPLLVGITGRARHGKNTVGELLTELGGHKQFAFADGVREMAYALDPVVEQLHGNRLSTLVDLEGWEETKKIDEVRRILQVLGTECVRDMIGEDSWVNALAKKTTPLFTNGRPVVVTDARFPNEARWIRRSGGEVWKVVREGFETDVNGSHASEALVDGIDADLTIRNNGTLEELELKVRKYCGTRGFAEPMSRYGVTV